MSLYGPYVRYCKNCGHQLYYAPGEGTEWFHCTRAYRNDLPFKTVECYAPNCNCKNPEPDDETLAEVERLQASSRID